MILVCMSSLWIKYICGHITYSFTFPFHTSYKHEPCWLIEQKKAIGHLDHYPPSPKASLDPPQSSSSLYSSVQESELLIGNLVEMTHQGARPFNRESEAFTPQMEPPARVNGSHNGRWAARLLLPHLHTSTHA